MCVSVLMCECAHVYVCVCVFCGMFSCSIPDIPKHLQPCQVYPGQGKLPPEISWLKQWSSREDGEGGTGGGGGEGEGGEEMYWEEAQNLTVVISSGGS